LTTNRDDDNPVILIVFVLKETTTLWEPTPEMRLTRLPKLKPPVPTMGAFESDNLWGKVLLYALLHLVVLLRVFH
jgi:hypothetical protein